MKALFVPLLLSALALPAHAQIPSSSAEFVGGNHAKDFVDGAIELKRLAACGIKLNDRYAKAMINSLPGTAIEDRSAGPMMNVMEHCMNDRHPAIRAGVSQMRGALAEEIYLSQYPSPPNFSLIDHSGMALPSAWTSAKLEGFTLSEVVSHDFAQCVVSANPVLADGLLRTEPRSAQEDQAIAKLKPLLGPCLMQGFKYSMDSAALRSYVAQALYRGMQMWPATGSAPNKAGGNN